MFFSARQLEQLLRESGGAGIILPYRARLTPAAQDWARLKKITVGYSDDSFRGQSAKSNESQAGSAEGKIGSSAGAAKAVDSGPAGTMLWWCDSPCGAAKGAIMAQAKESPVRPIVLPADAKLTSQAIKSIAAEIKAGSATGAVLIVQSAAVAMLLANRNPALRAVVGSNLDSVEQGIRLIGANVLVVEIANKPLPVVKSMLARFAKAKREISVELQKQLEEMTRT